MQEQSEEVVMADRMSIEEVLTSIKGTRDSLSVHRGTATRSKPTG